MSKPTAFRRPGGVHDARGLSRVINNPRQYVGGGFRKRLFYIVVLLLVLFIVTQPPNVRGQCRPGLDANNGDCKGDTDVRRYILGGRRRTAE